MVFLSFFEVSCQSYVSFSRCVSCESRLIYNVVCKALSFKGALFFLSAVAVAVKMLISTTFEMYRSFVKLPDECGHILPYGTDL